MELREQLADGQDSEVWCGELQRGRRRALVAIRQPKEGASLGGPGRASILSEIGLLCTLQHDCVVRLLGFVTVGNPLMAVFEFYPEGTLLDALRLGVVSGWKQSLPYCRDVACALAYIHTEGVLHRNVSAQHVLISGERAILSNFGLAARLAPDGKAYEPGVDKNALSVPWSPPEAIENGIYYHTSDIWAYGVLLYEVALGGQPPFAGQTEGEISQQLLRGFRPPPVVGTPRALYRLMTDCWYPAPNSRPSSREVLRRVEAVASVEALVDDCYH